MTGKDVTECTGGDVDEVTETDLKNRYLTQCDPRYELYLQKSVVDWHYSTEMLNCCPCLIKLKKNLNMSVCCRIMT